MSRATVDETAPTLIIPRGTRIEMDIPLAGAHAARGFAGERLAA